MSWSWTHCRRSPERSSDCPVSKSQRAPSKENGLVFMKYLAVGAGALVSVVVGHCDGLRRGTVVRFTGFLVESSGVEESKITHG